MRLAEETYALHPATQKQDSPPLSPPSTPVREGETQPKLAGSMSIPCT